jgi:hypothetical protein
MKKKAPANVPQMETYYPGDIFDRSWYCPRHGCYPRRNADDKCIVCAAEEAEKSRIEGLWVTLAKDLRDRARERWKEDCFRFRTNDSFVLTVEDVEKIIPADRRCPILGIRFAIAGGWEPVFKRTKPYPIWGWRLRRWGIDASPALDKIIPSKGYIPGNIAVISTLANRIKNNATDPEILRKVADWMEKQLKEAK